MKDNKKFENMDRYFTYEKLGPDDLEGVAGGTNYGRVYIDDEGFREDLITYKKDGWTYEEMLELLNGGLHECTDDERAFVLDYFNTVWNSI